MYLILAQSYEMGWGLCCDAANRPGPATFLYYRHGNLSPWPLTVYTGLAKAAESLGTVGNGARRMRGREGEQSKEIE